MGRKLKWLLMLVVFIVWIWTWYYYFFVARKGHLTLVWNIENYEVYLYSKELNKKIPSLGAFHSSCLQSKCELVDLPPFEFEMTISKEGYKDFVQVIQIIPHETLVIDFEVDKKLQITPIVNESWDHTPNQQDLKQIRLLTQMRKTYVWEEVEPGTFIYFEENEDDTLSMHFLQNDEDKLLYRFPKIPAWEISFMKIFQAIDQWWVIYGGELFVFDIPNYTVTKIWFPQNILYIKQNHNWYHIVTSLGSFLYDKKTKNTEYFYLFSDFVSIDQDTLLGVIYQDETEKKRNFGIDQAWNIIVRYTFSTQEMKVIEVLNFSIGKFISDDRKIYVYDSSWNQYEISHFK